jgi:hypothetical protein
VTGTESSNEEPQYSVVSGSPTAQEIAAVSVVLGAAIEEFGTELTVAEKGAHNSWSRGQRSLRAPLTPGPGAWRGFRS